MNGVDLIRAERRRQRSRRDAGEAYSLAHDDAHDEGEIARAAAAYALPPEFRRRNRELVGALEQWGWHLKLNTGDRIRELTKAGALIAAEIDRLLRAAVEEEARPDSVFVPEGDARCGFVMDACICMKRKGHEGLHACTHGGWQAAVEGDTENG